MPANAIDYFVAVKRDAEFVAREVHPERVPDAGRDLRVDVFERHAFAADRVINRDVVFERVRARDIVVVRVPHAPDHTAGLIFFSRNRLELHFNEAVREVGVVFDANRKGRRARLL